MDYVWERDNDLQCLFRNSAYLITLRRKTLRTPGRYFRLTVNARQVGIHELSIPWLIDIVATGLGAAYYPEGLVEYHVT